METKSRYEVIKELEDKKRTLIVERDSFRNLIEQKERNIRDEKRKLEDMESDLKFFKEGIEDNKKTLQELIDSIEETLKRFQQPSA